ncbi:MAG: hypothetical protein IT462_03045 [Planctomycetes bacterium]|nr:hypothetical protein [Planctomycetota bacterium]
MRHAIWALIFIVCGNLCAQTVTEEYRAERERARFAKPHGFCFEGNLFCYAPYFDQQQKVRAYGVPGDGVSYRRDFDGVPFGAFLDLDLRARFTWWDSLEFGYGFASLRAFKDFDEPTSFNGTTFPADVDGDYASDFHDFHLMYRRDFLYVGERSEFSLFFQVGIEWAIISTEVSSDDVPTIKHRETVRFREVLPWPAAGIGFNWNFGDHFNLRVDGYGSYINPMPTFQERDGKDVKQSLTSITGRALFEWRPWPFFSVLMGAQYRYLKMRLVAGFRQDNYLWWSVGPEIGVGFRF